MRSYAQIYPLYSNTQDDNRASKIPARGRAAERLQLRTLRYTNARQKKKGTPISTKHALTPALFRSTSTATSFEPAAASRREGKVFTCDTVGAANEDDKSNRINTR